MEQNEIENFISFVKYQHLVYLAQLFNGLELTITSGSKLTLILHTTNTLEKTR